MTGAKLVALMTRLLLQVCREACNFDKACLGYTYTKAKSKCVLYKKVTDILRSLAPCRINIPVHA